VRRTGSGGATPGRSTRERYGFAVLAALIGVSGDLLISTAISDAPLYVILVGVVWAFGLAGYLGIPLTIVTIAGLPVMLGVGIDYAIQMHARIEEEVVIDRAEHPIQETARNLGPALLVVTFDAIFAFAAGGCSYNPAHFPWIVPPGRIEQTHAKPRLAI